MDRFTNNLKSFKLISKYLSRNIKINIFTVHWSRDYNWLCPSGLRHLILRKDRGALLVPICPSSYYWPLIYPDGKQMTHFVRQYIVIEPFYSAEARKSVFSGHPKFKTLV